MRILRINLLLACLLGALMLAGCAAHVVSENVPVSEPEPAPVSHEGGIGGTGKTDECRNADGNSKQDCRKEPLP